MQLKQTKHSKFNFRQDANVSFRSEDSRDLSSDESFDLSEEEDAEHKPDTQMHKKRYGGVFVKKRVSSTIKITGLVMVVILIPLNDFFEHFLRPTENAWILAKQ